MYICICKQVTEKQIKAAVNDGARSMYDLRNELGVANQCGQCGICAKALLKEYTANATAQTPPPKKNYLSTPIKVFPSFGEAVFSND